MILHEMFRYNTHGLLGVAVGIIDIAVGLVVLSRNPKSPINRSFFFVTYSTFVWITAFGFESLVRTKEMAFFWQSVGYANGVPFIQLSFYIFSRAWTQQKLNAISVWMVFFWSVLAVIPMSFLTRQVVGMEEYSWGRFPYFLPTAEARAYAAFVLIPFFFCVFLSIRNFYRGWKRAVSPQEQRQFKTVLIGYVIAHLGASDFITGFHHDFYPCGYISLSIFITLVAYTIVRYKFLEINLLLQKVAAIFLIYVFLIAIVTPLGFVFLGPTLAGFNRDQFLHVLFFCFISAIVISMGPLVYAYLTRNSFWLRSRTSTGLTHELKSPLSAIESSVFMLLQTQSREQLSPTTLTTYLDIIDRNAQRLRVFINDLLRLAQIHDDNNLGIAKTSVELSRLITDVVEQYRPMAKQKGLDLVFHESVITDVEVDQEKIRQVISNLLSNAIKFSERGTIQIRLKSTPRDRIISFVDEGCGIPPGDIKRIFDRFHQGRHAQQGSGIGLTIAKAWVEAHSGKIWAESDGEGKGTTVTFTLPI